MSTISPVSPSFLSPIEGGDPVAADGLSRQLDERLARDQMARDNRQASVKISVTEDSYVGVGAFGLKNTPQELLNWAFVGVNANTLVNGAGALGNLLGVENQLTNTKDMTLRVYGEIGHPALGQSDVFALSRVKAGLTPEGQFELRSGLGVVGIDFARPNGVLGVGSGKGFDSVIAGASVDFKKMTVSPVLDGYNGVAVPGAMRGRDAQEIQTPGLKSVGYVFVESTDPKHSASLTRVAAMANPGAGLAVRTAVMGEAVNNAMVNPKQRLDANGQPYVTTMTLRGMAVLGVPTPAGVVAGAGIDGRVTIQFIEDGKNDIIIDNPFGADIKTSPQQIADAAKPLLQPVSDTLNATRQKIDQLVRTQGEPATFGSPIDPVKQQRELQAQGQAAHRKLIDDLRKTPGYQPTPALGSGTVTVNGQAHANVPTLPQAQSTQKSPSVQFSNGQTMTFAELQKNIAAMRYSHSEQSTRDASATLDVFKARFPQQVSAREYTNSFNTLWSGYLTGAARSKVGEVSQRASQLGQGVTYSAAQAASLSRISEGVRNHVQWQQKNGLAPMWPADQLKQLQQWTEFVGARVQR
jgi:hypothetical protein